MPGNRRVLIFCILLFAAHCFAADEPVYEAAGRRNPFIPLVTPDGRLLKLESQGPSSGLLLEGIIYDERGLSYAIINGEIVKVSDKVNGYQVLKIEEGKVILVKEGDITEIELKEE